MKQQSSLLLLVTAALMAVLFALACTENAATPDESDDSQSSSSKEVSSDPDDPDDDPDDSSSSSKGKSRSSSSSEESDDEKEPGDSSSSKTSSSSSKARSSSSKTSSSSSKTSSSSSSSVKADADKSSSSQGAAGNEKCKEAGSFETVPTEENTCVKYEGKCYTCNIWAPNNDGYWCGQEDGWFFKTTGLADNIGKSQEATWYTEVDCNGEAPKPSSSSAGEPNEPGDPGDLTTKAGIQAYIDENWQKVGGYSSKPTKVIALSYDDGPCGQTQALLNVLKEKNVKTTFFVIGQNIGSQQSAMRNMYADGHEIANHSNGYDSGPSQSSIQSCSDAIKNITGSNPTLFRAPNFSYSQGLTQSCTNLGLPIIHAECTSGDYNQGQTGSQTISAVTNCAKDGAIVNLHEGNTAPNTVGATGQLIDQLRADGYWIMPVGQMAIYKGVKLNAGSQYQKF